MAPDRNAHVGRSPMGTKSITATNAAYLQLLREELRLRGYENFDLTKRSEFSNTHIAVVMSPLGNEQRSAIILRTLRNKRRVGMELLTLEAHPNGKAISAIETLAKKFPWVVVSSKSFDLMPGGPFIWHELIKKDQLKLHFEGSDRSLDELRGTKPVRRVRALLEAIVAKPKVTPPPVVPPRFRTIPTPRGRAHNRVDEMTLRQYPEASIGRK